MAKEREKHRHEWRKLGVKDKLDRDIVVCPCGSVELLAKDRQSTYGLGRIPKGTMLLGIEQGKEVQDVLNRYRDELISQRVVLHNIGEDTFQIQKDIDYVGKLWNYFED